MKKIMKRIAAGLAALAALWFALQAGRHRGKQAERAREVRRLEAEKGKHVAEAKIARERQKAARHAAHTALANGRANIAKVKEKADAPFADRVDRLARSLRGDA